MDFHNLYIIGQACYDSKNTTQSLTSFDPDLRFKLEV